MIGGSQTASSRCRSETQLTTKWFTWLAGECDNMIVVLKLITNLVKGNKFGVGVKGLIESSKGQAGGIAGNLQFGGQCQSLGHHGWVGGSTMKCTKSSYRNSTRNTERRV